MLKLRERPHEFFESDPVASISCITFNQREYVKSSLDYFLDQETNFPVEILVNDDASTDGTSEIILEYAKRFPHIIKPFIQPENQYRQGVLGFHKVFNFGRAKGEFIGICDGDDFWIDKRKLQKQVDFLRNNPDFSLSSHDSFLKIYNRKKDVNLFFSIIKHNLTRSPLKYNLGMLKDLILFKDNFWNRLLANATAKRFEVADFELTLRTYPRNVYIPASSIVGRAKVFKAIPEEFRIDPTGHKIHILWSACFGKLGHSLDIMTLKNNQQNSLTVTRDHIAGKRTWKDKMNFFVELYNKLKPYVNDKQKDIIERVNAELLQFDRRETVK